MANQFRYISSADFPHLVKFGSPVPEIWNQKVMWLQLKSLVLPTSCQCWSSNKRNLFCWAPWNFGLNFLTFSRCVINLQVANYVELFRMEDNQEKCMIQPVNQDFENLTGKPPVSLKEWCKLHASDFQWRWIGEKPFLAVALAQHRFWTREKTGAQKKADTMLCFEEEAVHGLSDRTINLDWANLKFS